MEKKLFIKYYWLPKIIVNLRNILSNIYKSMYKLQISNDLNSYDLYTIFEDYKEIFD